MQYSLVIFYLLITFSYFDEIDEEYSFLPEETRQMMRETQKCHEAENDQTSCFNVKLSIQNFQCCMLKLTTNDEILNSCSILGGSVEEAKKIKSSSKIKSLLREIYGFNSYGLFSYKTIQEKDKMAQEGKYKQEYLCKDGSFEISYGYEEYSDSDKEKLLSEKHCLKYFYSYLNLYSEETKNPSKEDCFNADLLDSSKNSGIQCSYYEFNLKYITGDNEIYKTCYLYDPDIKTTKNIDENSIDIFQTLAYLVASYKGKQYSGYTVEFTSSDGDRFSYDPMKQEGKQIPDFSSTSFQFFKSKFILILVLILF